MTQYRVVTNISLWVIFLLATATSFAQITIVKGMVIDSVTKQPLQNVSVYFKGRNGTITDSNGHYQLQTIYNVSIIQFAYAGLHTISYPILKGKTQEINTQLGPDVSLSNVTENKNVATDKVFLNDGIFFKLSILV